MRQRVSNFRLYCSSKKFQMLRKNVKSLLEQFQVCIFAEIVFGVRCTLNSFYLISSRHLVSLLMMFHLAFLKPYPSYLSVCFLQCCKHIVLVPAVNSLICEDQPQPSIFLTFICIILNPESFKQITE